MTNISQTTDFTALKEQFGGAIIMPGDTEYEARATTMAGKGTPAVIFQPETPQDIAQAILFAKSHDLALSVRSGGHNMAGFATNQGGAVIDLTRLNTVEILDPTTHIVRLGAGAVWGDVAAKLGEQQLAISSGDTKSVGVGGLTLGGGIGWMVRKYGYAIDSLVAAEIVLADGSIVRVNDSQNSDLFWAIRGGGGSFGVVTSFDFQAHPQGKIVESTIKYGADNIVQTITGWRDHLRMASKDLTSFMVLMPNLGPMPAGVIVASCYANDDEAAANTAIEPLRHLGDPVSDNTATIPYADMLQESRVMQGMHFTVKSMYAKTLSDELIAVLSEICCKPGAPMVQLRMMNGAADNIDPQATAMAHRKNEIFLYASYPAPIGTPQDQIAASLQSWEKLAAFSTGAYGNFLSTNTPGDVAQIYPGATYQRLAKIKQQYDPTNVFSNNFTIVPATV